MEQELTSALEHRLLQYPASLALKRRIAAQWKVSTPTRSLWSWWRPSLVPAFAFVALVLVGTPIVYYERAAFRGANATSAMVGEAVNDHLRVLSSQRPLEIESGGFTR
jgi:hypothetical protein